MQILLSADGTLKKKNKIHTHTQTYHSGAGAVGQESDDTASQCKPAVQLTGAGRGYLQEGSFNSTAPLCDLQWCCGTLKFSTAAAAAAPFTLYFSTRYISCENTLVLCTLHV